MAIAMVAVALWHRYKVFVLLLAATTIASVRSQPLRPVIVNAGGDDTCAVLEDRTTKCWGNNAHGHLGLGDTNYRGDEPGEMGNNLPVVDFGTGRYVVTMSSGYNHRCAVLDNSALKCWGQGDKGQLGYEDDLSRGMQPGDMGDNLPEVNLGTGLAAVKIASGDYHQCAVLNNSKLKCWGEGEQGQTGLMTAADRGRTAGEMGDNLPYVDLGAGRMVLDVTCGDYHTCVVMENRAIKCFGAASQGQLGYEDKEERGKGDKPNQMGDNLPEVNLGAGRSAVKIAAGFYHTCALLDDSTVKCWGYGGAGQLGQGSGQNIGKATGEMGDALPAIDLGTGRTAIDINTGATFTCALLDDYSVKCWGENKDGELGIGDTEARGKTPGTMGDSLPAIDFGGGRYPTLITSGDKHSCAVLSDGFTKCWGLGKDGQLGFENDQTYGNTLETLGDGLPWVDFGSTTTSSTTSSTTTVSTSTRSTSTQTTVTNTSSTTTSATTTSTSVTIVTTSSTSTTTRLTTTATSNTADTIIPPPDASLVLASDTTTLAAADTTIPAADATTTAAADASTDGTSTPTSPFDTGTTTAPGVTTSSGPDPANGGAGAAGETTTLAAAGTPPSQGTTAPLPEGAATSTTTLTGSTSSSPGDAGAGTGVGDGPGAGGGAAPPDGSTGGSGAGAGAGDGVSLLPGPGAPTVPPGGSTDGPGAGAGAGDGVSLLPGPGAPTVDPSATTPPSSSGPADSGGQGGSGSGSGGTTVGLATPLLPSTTIVGAGTGTGTTTTAIGAVVSTGDTYPAAAAGASADTSLGFNAAVALNPRRIVVQAVKAESWADGARVAAGDQLQSINGVPTASMTSDDIFNLLGTRPLNLVFTRGDGQLPAVTWTLEELRGCRLFEATAGQQNTQLGFSTGMVDGNLSVVAVSRGMWAELSQLWPSDLLVALNGRKTSEMADDEVAQLLQVTRPLTLSLLRCNPDTNGNTTDWPTSFPPSATAGTSSGPGKSTSVSIFSTTVASADQGQTTPGVFLVVGPDGVPTTGFLPAIEAVAQTSDTQLGLSWTGTLPAPVRLTSVDPGTWAAQVGMVAGDVLLAINGQAVTNMTKDNITRTLQATRPLTLRFVPGVSLDPDKDRYIVTAGTEEATLGFQPQGSPPDPVLVTQVTPGSWADQNGLREGDQILAVNGVSELGMSPTVLRSLLLQTRPLTILLWRKSQGQGPSTTWPAGNNTTPQGEPWFNSELMVDSAWHQGSVWPIIAVVLTLVLLPTQC